MEQLVRIKERSAAKIHAKMKVRVGMMDTTTLVIVHQGGLEGTASILRLHPVQPTRAKMVVS